MALWNRCTTVALIGLSLGLAGCVLDEPQDKTPLDCDHCGYWDLWSTTDGLETGPEIMVLELLNDKLMFGPGCDPEHATISVTLADSAITFEVQDAGETKTAHGIIDGSHMAGTWTGSSGDSGTWRGEELDSASATCGCVGRSADAFCSYFTASDQYYVQAYVRDPSHVLEAIDLTGDGISGTRRLTYNLYPQHPGEWWSDPSVFISQGAAPTFPLNYVFHLRCKGGLTENVSRSVNGWETVN